MKLRLISMQASRPQIFSCIFFSTENWSKDLKQWQSTAVVYQRVCAHLPCVSSFPLLCVCVCVYLLPLT